MTEVCFVLARGQNHFFVEIAEAMGDELGRLGVPSSISREGFPPMVDGLVYVLVPPHEYRALAPPEQWPTPRQLERTIFYCFEQPGTFFFNEDVRMSWGPAGAVLDVSQVGVDEFRRHGVRASHAPLGWTPTWSHHEPAGSADGLDQQRDIDVLHLGIYSDRRAAVLARHAALLERWRTCLLLGDDQGPNAEGQANFVIEQEKWHLLSRSRVLLNVHVGPRRYFEWHRVIQAISNGVLVVSEHSTGNAPLVPGDHLVMARPEALGGVVQPFLEDEARRAALAQAAFAFVKREMPLSRSAELLAEIADTVALRAPAKRAGQWARIRDGATNDEEDQDIARTVALRGPPESGPLVADPRDRDPASDVQLVPWPYRAGIHVSERAPALAAALPDPNDGLAIALSSIRAGVKALRLEQARTDRALARLQIELRHGAPPPLVERVAATAGYAGAKPRVSVLTALYNYEHHIGRALDTVSTSHFRPVEIVVVDDGSSDGSLQAVRRWMQRHEDVPVLLIRHPVNRSLGPARNTALDFARGELSFVLDADNELFPRGLARLVEALEHDPGAACAYGIAEAFSSSGAPRGLINVYPWQPWRFADGNFIDAMALWRTSTLRRLGGYSEDLRLYGWEDYDLYCRVAERGLRGLHVPQIVARYRVNDHSMLSLTNLSVTTAVSMLVERHPTLLARVGGQR